MPASRVIVKIKKLLIKTCVVLVSLILALTVGEVVARMFNLGTVKLTETQGDAGHYRPHIKFLNRKENQNWVETNSFGFHDLERERTSTKHRILFLGDSYVEGLQVPTDNLFTSILEKRFVESGRAIECLNGGVSGSGTVHQYMLWKKFFEGRVTVNHLTLVIFMGNDLEDNNIDLSFPPTDNGMYLTSTGQVFKYEVKEGLLKRMAKKTREYSVLANTLYQSAYLLRRKRLKSQTDGEESAAADTINGERVVKEKDKAAWRAAEDGTLALIKNWNAELVQRNISMDTVIIDRPQKVYNTFELDFMEKLRTLCAQQNIGYVRPELKPDPYQVYSFDGKTLGHLNYQGHEVFASELYTYFLSKYAEMGKL